MILAVERVVENIPVQIKSYCVERGCNKGKTTWNLSGESKMPLRKYRTRYSDAGLPFNHPGASVFENLFFLLGQALDALSRDFFENGIDLAAHEFRGSDFGIVLF